MNMGDVFEALRIMGAGMAGIFATLSIIYGFIVLLVKSFPMEKKATEE